MNSLAAPFPFPTRPSRPIGVTITTILQIIDGIGDFLLGILLVIAYAVVSALSSFFSAGYFALIPALLLALAIIFFGLGVFAFVLGYGLWTGRGWAWILSIVNAIIGVILTASGLILSGLSFASLVFIFPIVVNLLKLVFLSLSNVRSFFGFGPRYPIPGGPPYMPQTQSPYVQPAPQQPYYQQQAAWGIACSYCGAPNHSAANFCDRCGNRLR